MTINDKSQISNGREGRPPGAPALGAGWGQALGLALLMFSAVPSFSGARPILDGDSERANAKFSGDLQQRAAGSNNMVTVIVQYRQMPTELHLKSMQDGGATIKSRLHTIRAVTMRVPASMLAVLASNPNVAYVTPDRPVSLTASNEDYTTAVEADVAASQFAQAGTGVGVAIIDSGVADHADLHN